MTTATATPTTGRVGATPAARLSFAGILRSQWIALSSLRGNLVSLVLGLVLTIGVAAGMATMFGYVVTDQQGGGMPPLPSVALNGMVIALAVASLVAVSAYAKEHSTGTQRTLLAAAPTRAAVIGAKAVVLFASSFVAALVALGLSATAGAALYGAFGQPVAWEGMLETLVLPILGAAFYIAAAAVLSLAIAVLLRSETWGIMLSLFFLLMVPTVFAMLPFDWAGSVRELLMPVAAEHLYASFDGFDLELLADLGLVVAWPAVALVSAMAVERSRDA